MSQLPTGPDTTPTPVYNPDIEDYVFYYSVEGEKKKYIMPGLDIVIFPKWLADHAANTLADILFQKRGQKTNYFKDKEDILREIYVEI